MDSNLVCLCGVGNGVQPWKIKFNEPTHKSIGVLIIAIIHRFISYKDANSQWDSTNQSTNDNRKQQMVH